MTLPNFRVPPNLPPGLGDFLERFIKAVGDELQVRTPDTSGQHSTILLSPDGSAWEATVDDTGTITTTKVRGGV